MSIRSSQELQVLHERLFFDGVKPGVLRIEDGSLQWGNIDCILQCTTCGQRFHLNCDTERGSPCEFRLVD